MQRMRTLLNYYAPTYRGGALSDTTIRPSVRLSVPWHSCPRRAAGVDPTRVELPSAGAYRLAAYGATTFIIIVTRNDLITVALLRERCRGT